MKIRIYSCRNNTKLKNRNFRIDKTHQYRNHNYFFRKISDSSNHYLFKTIDIKSNSSLKHNENIKKSLFLKTCRTKYPRRTDLSPKIPTKILNDFFNYELSKSSKSILTPKTTPRFTKAYNYSTENKREISKYNYLYYFFPKLFNVPNNRIEGISKLNASKYFISPLSTPRFKEEVKNLKISIFNKKENDNGKSLYSSIISNSKEEDKYKKNPLFIQKLYDIDVLKNVRFGFKNSVEKGKFSHLFKSFYTEKNLKYFSPKSS